MPNNQPTSALRLREADARDTSLIASMHARSWIAAYRGMLPDAYLDDEVQADRAEHWKIRMPEIEAGAGRVLIAERDGDAIGFVCMIESDESGSVLIDNLHALPGYRGRGVGTAMLDEAARWARSRGARAMHLSVLEHNEAAIGFYESHGWQRMAREADHVAGIDVFSLRYAFPLA